MADAPKNTAQAGDAPRGTVRPMTPEEIRQANAAAEAEVMAEALSRNATDMHPGGRYLVDGRLVDAEGRPVKDKQD